MPSEGTPATPSEPRDTLGDALAELRDDFAPGPGETADRYWLRVGLALGLRRPGRAQLLIERLEAETAGRSSDGASVSTSWPATEMSSDAIAGTGDEADVRETDEVPVASRLLVRAAALPLDEPPETAFGWVLRLRSEEITLMGRILDGLVEGGGPRDLARGFGLAWTGNVKLANSELNGLFGRFTDLELTLASVLSGNDIREAAKASKPSLSTVVQGWFMPRAGPGADEAATVLDRMGGPAQRGLIAVWNTWAAVRYRSLMPAPMYEQLTQAWVTVVGRLPEA